MPPTPTPAPHRDTDSDRSSPHDKGEGSPIASIGQLFETPPSAAGEAVREFLKLEEARDALLGSKATAFDKLAAIDFLAKQNAPEVIETLLAAMNPLPYRDPLQAESASGCLTKLIQLSAAKALLVISPERVLKEASSPSAPIAVREAAVHALVLNAEYRERVLKLITPMFQNAPDDLGIIILTALKEAFHHRPPDSSESAAYADAQKAAIQFATVALENRSPLTSRTIEIVSKYLIPDVENYLIERLQSRPPALEGAVVAQILADSNTPRAVSALVAAFKDDAQPSIVHQTIVENGRLENLELRAAAREVVSRATSPQRWLPAAGILRCAEIEQPRAIVHPDTIEAFSRAAANPFQARDVLYWIENNLAIKTFVDGAEAAKAILSPPLWQRAVLGFRSFAEHLLPMSFGGTSARLRTEIGITALRSEPSLEIRKSLLGRFLKSADIDIKASAASTIGAADPDAKRALMAILISKPTKLGNDREAKGKCFEALVLETGETVSELLRNHIERLTDFTESSGDANLVRQRLLKLDDPLIAKYLADVLCADRRLDRSARIGGAFSIAVSLEVRKKYPNLNDAFLALANDSASPYHFRARKVLGLPPLET